ncbi:glycosyltransferase [Rhodanobacter glycinis]|uniref:glycosyltransferase family 2 protein n=1 Tax=Rhodanobacter glycinis TaxID=582702 RepID=UPI00112ECE96|nr:glycosyltransferase family 2 protein [Rhodanobacter glycinis]TPG47840.1 glycosyltransferase [Rhodanobacter glycinis]
MSAMTPAIEQFHTATPQLSIIVATWNAARTFERCLKSIDEQSFTNWELLIADGASTDGTVDLIRKHESHIAWWQSKKDGGIYDAWNQALTHAQGEYVCFLGADDAWADSDALARLITAARTQEYDLVTSQGLIFDPATSKEMHYGSAWNYRRIGRHMVVCHPGLLHRRSLFERYGSFNTQYRIAGDLDFLLRLPVETRAIHLDVTSVLIEAAGISRKNVLARLREQREILARCKRYGTFRAYLCWLDKLWRYPIARLFNISH